MHADEFDEVAIREDPGTGWPPSAASGPMPVRPAPATHEFPLPDPPINAVMIDAEAGLEVPQGVALPPAPTQVHPLQLEDHLGDRPPGQPPHHPLHRPPAGMFHEEHFLILRPCPPDRRIAQPELSRPTLNLPGWVAQLPGEFGGPALDTAVIPGLQSCIPLRRPYIFFLRRPAPVIRLAESPDPAVRTPGPAQ